MKKVKSEFEKKQEAFKAGMKEFLETNPNVLKSFGFDDALAAEVEGMFGVKKK